MRGIRGATTATANTAEAITEATDELLRALIDANELEQAEVCFAFFTTTKDLTVEFPALAARLLGWVDVPLLCANEMDIDGPNPRGVPMCIRILLLYNTDKPQSAMRTVYLRGALAIKADLDAKRGAIRQ